jgi:hypothetical protein
MAMRVPINIDRRSETHLAVESYAAGEGVNMPEAWAQVVALGIEQYEQQQQQERSESA